MSSQFLHRWFPCQRGGDEREPNGQKLPTQRELERKQDYGRVRRQKRGRQERERRGGKGGKRGGARAASAQGACNRFLRRNLTVLTSSHARTAYFFLLGRRHGGFDPRTHSTCFSTFLDSSPSPASNSTNNSLVFFLFFFVFSKRETFLLRLTVSEVAGERGFSARLS